MERFLFLALLLLGLTAVCNGLGLRGLQDQEQQNMTAAGPAQERPRAQPSNTTAAAQPPNATTTAQTQNESVVLNTTEAAKGYRRGFHHHHHHHHHHHPHGFGVEGCMAFAGCVWCLKCFRTHGRRPSPRPAAAAASCESVPSLANTRTKPYL